MRENSNITTTAFLILINKIIKILNATPSTVATIHNIFQFKPKNLFQNLIKRTIATPQGPRSSFTSFCFHTNDSL